MASSGWSRHGPAEYAGAWEALLPTGPAWPRDYDGVLMRLVAGLAAYWGDPVDKRAADLLTRESDPRATLELLSDWERAWGLPDPCVAEPLTIADRQIALVTKMTMLGAQSRAFFESLAGVLGYTVRIREYAPVMAGVTEVGDTAGTHGMTFPEMRWELGPPENRFFWTVQVDNVRLTWFTVGGAGGECGIDPLLRIGVATDLECLIRRWKPAHTDVVFDYTPFKVDMDFQDPANSWLV